MEQLRWILLAIGIIFIILIYAFDKKRRKTAKLKAEIRAKEDDRNITNLDNVTEGVGSVRIIPNAGPAATDETLDMQKAQLADEFQDILQLHSQKMDSQADAAQVVTEIDEVPESKNVVQESLNQVSNNFQSNPKISPNNSQNKPDSAKIIVLYILPEKQTHLLGTQINSAVKSLGLRLGAMKVYHFSDDKRVIFSLANMLEPGSFNEEKIHDLKTPGLTAFMQIKETKALDDLTEMLQRCYQISRLLNANLCNQQRQILTEQDARNYRTQVREYLQVNHSTATDHQ